MNKKVIDFSKAKETKTEIAKWEAAKEAVNNCEHAFRCNCGNELFTLFVNPKTLEFTGMFCPDCHAFKDF